MEIKIHDFQNYINSSICFSDQSEQERISSEIIKHKKFLDERLGRDIGIEVALIDYLKNINQDVKIPDIFNSYEIEKINHRNNNYKNIKYYDTSILSIDIKTEIERAHRYGSHFSILLFDCVLKDNMDLSNISPHSILNINNIFRLTDTLYRYSSNRFLLLLPGANTDEAANAAHKLQAWFDNQVIDGFPEGQSVNIGVAVFGLYDVDNEYKILAAADISLRKAKKLGKNRTILFQGADLLEINHKDLPPLKILKKQKRWKVKGIPINPGYALGTVFIYNDNLSHELETYDISEANLASEFDRIIEAINKVEKELINVEDLVCSDLTPEYSAIFQAHRLILKDNQIFSEIKHNLYETKVNGETIVRDVFKKWEKRFLEFEDEIFRNKSQDIADISRRILRELQGLDSHLLENAPEESIILATRLLPSDTVNLDKKHIKAIVLKEGGRFSHTAILSKAMKIPLVIAEDLDLAQFDQTERIFVDGKTGIITFNPSEEEERKMIKNIEKYKLNESVNNKKILDLFYKGEKIYIKAAASNLEETNEAITYGADGIGLFRIEVLYLTQTVLPDESFLVRELEQILEPCRTNEIVMRLLDIGGDKNLPYLNTIERYNSSLGLRGVRLFRKYPHLLETQLRALIKISQNFNIKILIPMVTILDDIIFVKNMIARIKKKLKIKNNIPIGAMIETPASVLLLDSILEQTDFISIGSNDLIQYTVAADREKLSVSNYYEEGNKIVLDFIRIVNDKTISANIPCSLCGELAQNTNYTRELLELGTRNFTIIPSVIPSFRKTLKQYVD